MPAHERGHSDRLIHELIKAAARHRPDAVAVDSGDGVMTYARLCLTADHLCDQFLGSVVTANEPIAVALRRGPLLVPTLLAVWQAGGCYVPLDAGLPRIRTDRVLQEASRYGMRWVLTDPETAANLDLTVHSTLTVPGVTGSVVACRADATPSPVQPVTDGASRDRVAYIMYTSGSTGRPKGTVVTHANVAAFVRAIEHAIGAEPDEVTLATTALTFDISVLEIFWPLSQGRRVCLLDAIPNTDTDRLKAVVLAGAPTLLQLTPSTAEILDLPHAPTSLRILVGGEALSGATAARLLPRCRKLYNMYGPTEATVWFTFHPVGPGDRDAATVSLGRPLPNCEVMILDEHRRVVPDGVTGELYLYGPQIAAGYLDAAATSAQFLTDLLPGQVVYRTGDLARWLPGGTLDFRGRRDGQVKIGGHRVELGDIEANLREHPRVTNAAVIVDRSVTPPALRAYVHVSRLAEEADQHTESVLLDWLRLFDTEFAEMADAAEPAPDFRVWRSAIDGEPISKTQMREWLSACARLVRSLGARRVVDVGCGTGDLLYALGDAVDSYVGIEPTPAAIPRLRHMAAVHRHERASFVRAFAHELRTPSVRDGIRTALTCDAGQPSPDCVVINSVIQYFPSLSYLSDVLDQAFELLEDGGALVVADVRSLPLLPRLMARVAGHSPRRRRSVINNELCIDPLYFVQWARRQPSPASIWVLPKATEASNEIVDFRFDVVLTKRAPDRGEYEFGDYRAVGGTVADVLRWLSDSITARRARVLRGIPNARLVDTHDDSAVAVAPIDLRRAVADLTGVVIGLDPVDREAGSLMLAYNPSGHPDWAAASAGCTPPEVLGTRPWMAVAEEAIGTELLSYLSARLPRHMIPARIRVVDALPLTSNGKIDRVGLASDPPGGWEAAPLSASVAAAATPTDAAEPLDIVMTLVSALLGGKVSPDVDIIDAGGTSLDAARLAGVLWSRWGWSVTAGHVLRARTARSIAALAPRGPEPAQAALSRSLPAAQPQPIRDVRPEPAHHESAGSAAPPLSLAQRALLSLAYLDVASSERMNIVMRWRLGGRIDPHRIQTALRRLASRHQLLRTTISISATTSVLPASWQPELREADWSDDDFTATQIALKPFDLAATPPSRWALRWISAQRADLYAVLHHICVDDAALRTLHEDFVAAYAGDLNDPEAFADRLATALAAERRLHRERAAEARAYWTGRRGSFDGCGGFVRSAAMAGATNRRYSSLIHGGSKALDEQARQAGITSYAMFLAVSGWAVAQEFAEAAVLAGVPMSSREIVGGDDELGCFANLFPVAVRRDASDRHRYLSEVSEAVLAGLDHGLLPFAEIARLASLPHRGLGEAPFGLICQLEPAFEPTVAEGTTIAASLERPTRQLHPVTLRGERTGDGLAVHLDAESTLMDADTAARVLCRVTSAIRHWNGNGNGNGDGANGH